MNDISTGLLADTTELRKLIVEHPDYPICVLAGECANDGEYSSVYCSIIRVETGIILDCYQPVDEDIVFTDKDDFYERLEEWLWDTGDWNETEEVFLAKLAEEKVKYEPYWKNCIVIFADN